MFTSAALPVVYVKGSFVDGPCPVNLFLLLLPGCVLEPVGHDNPVLADVVLELLALSHLKSTVESMSFIKCQKQIARRLDIVMENYALRHKAWS